MPCLTCPYLTPTPRTHRCSAEQQVNAALSEKVHSSYREVSEVLKPRLLDALDKDDTRAVQAVQTDLARLEAEMEGVMQQALSGKLPLIEQMLRAGVYQMYELQSMCADCLGGQGGRGSVVGMSITGMCAFGCGVIPATAQAPVPVHTQT